MKDLTIDIQIMRIGSGVSDGTTLKRYYYDTKKLLDLMKTDDDFYLVFDHKGKISRQYSKHLRGHFGEQWIKMMADKDKIKTVNIENLKHSHRKPFTKLQSTGFISKRGEDLKFVETATQSDCHIIVTYEPDFYKNEKTLKQIPVYIKPCRDCIC